MDRDTQLLMERARQRRQQLNEELNSTTCKENVVCSAAVKRKTEKNIHENETPTKKSSFNENDRHTEKTEDNAARSAGHLGKCYPLDELEELAKAATQDAVNQASSDLKAEPQRSRLISTQSLDPDSVHRMASEELRKARLAALAARIDSYEDDQISSSSSSCRKKEPTMTGTVAASSLESLETAPPPPLPLFAEMSKLRDQDQNIRSCFKPSEGAMHFIRPYVQNVEKPSTTNVSLAERKSQFSALSSRISGLESNLKQREQQSINDNKSHLMPIVKQPILTPKMEDNKFQPKTTTSDKKSVAMLRDRWEYATRQGLPLKPEDSFTKGDEEITAAAIRLFSSRKPTLFPRTTINAKPLAQEEQKSMPIPPKFASDGQGTSAGKQPEPEKEGRTEIPQKHVLHSTAGPNKFESSIEVQSFTEEEEDTYDADNTTEYDTELDNCLDQAIDAATNAARDHSLMMRNQNMSKNETYHTAVTSYDINTTATAKLNEGPLMPRYNSTFLDETRPSEGNSTRIVHTVSMYRQLQKQHDADSLTPIRTVVKPPTSPSSKFRSDKQDLTSRNDNSAAFLHAEEYDEKIKKLNESISIQQEQILQASRALNFCTINEEFHGSIEEVDAHKVLRVAVERRRAFQDEYERVLKCRSKRQPIELNLDEPRGTLTFSYISLALKRDFVNDRINAIGDHVYYFMCLIKYRDQVLSTQVADSDRAIGAGGRIELLITNYLNLKDLMHDFDVEVLVFALRLRRDEMAKEQKYHSRTATLRNKLRPLSASYITSKTSLGGPGTIIDSKFNLAGQITINKSSVSRQKFALQGYQGNIPIEPVVQLKMRCSPETTGHVEERGFLSLHENITGLAAWRRFWCLLKDGLLRFWAYPDEETAKAPLYLLDLSRCQTKYLEPVNLEICTRPNTFLLEIVNDKSVLEKRLMSTDDKESFQIWSESLNRMLHNLQLWNPDI